MKKKFCLLFVVFVNLFTIFAQDSLAIANDCEVLKEYLQEASIDVSMAIDEGLIDIDDVIQKIKDEYDSVKNKDKRDKKNSKGIYPEIFARSIRKILSKELPYKNLHMWIKSKNYSEDMFDNQFVFYSQVYFEKKGNEYFVEESNVRSIKKGMKYTGDEQSLFKVIHNNKELYRFAVFNYYNQKKAAINIENKIKKIPVKWIQNYVKNEEISYKNTDKSIVISITTCSPKDLEKFRKTVSEIRKQLETTDKMVIIDLRNNSGGLVSNIYYILYSLLLSPSEENLVNFNGILNYTTQNHYELNTQKIRDRVLVDGNKEKFTRLKLDKNKYVKGYGSLDNSKQVKIKIDNPKYKKNLYILTNNNTVSAAEDFIFYSKKLYDKTILIGENTYGCIVFGDPYRYSLPDSKISLNLTATDNRQCIALLSGRNWKGEGNGFYPDYWATSEEIVETMVYLTKDEELRKVILTGKQ